MAKFGSWRNRVNSGRIQKRARENPTRERLNVVKALSRLGIPYRQAVAFLNPDWHGIDNTLKTGIMWLDFCCYSSKKKTMFAILFWGYYTGSQGGRDIGPKKKAMLEAKKKFLAEKNIPFLVIPRKYSPQEYQVVIWNYVQKLPEEGGLDYGKSPIASGSQQANDSREPARNTQTGKGVESV